MPIPSPFDCVVPRPCGSHTASSYASVRRLTVRASQTVLFVVVLDGCLSGSTGSSLGASQCPASPASIMPQALEAETAENAAPSQVPIAEPASEESSTSEDQADDSTNEAEPVSQPARYLDSMPPVDRKDAPARETANLSSRACSERMRSAKFPVKPAGAASGVATPVRLDGPFHGVSFRGPGVKSKYSIMDCRLVLAIDAFAMVLASHGVKGVHYGSAYRPKALFLGKKGRTPSQHSYGLAMDVVQLDMNDGTVLRVEHDYLGAVGSASCGPDAVMIEPTSRAILLRNIVCDVARAGVFHHILTPNFDAAHRTHLHFDIQRDGIWISVR